MNVSWFPIDRLQMFKCEVCGRAFAHQSGFVPIARICRSCLGLVSE